MSNDEEWSPKEDKEIEREKNRVKWELSDIKEELMYDLDDDYDDLKDEIDDLRDEAEDIKDELREELDELIEEREELLGEIIDIRGEVEIYGGDAREKIEEVRRKYERLKLKIEKHENKFKEKVQKRVDKAKKKAARINISVDEDMSDEWKDWAEGLGASVSELVRKSMKFVKNNIGDIAKLEQLGVKLEKMGEGLEKAVKESGIEELGEQLEKKYGKQKGKSKINVVFQTDSDKDRIKKRVAGLVKLHKSLPIDKLAQALNKSDDYAENLIYELAAEGIEGELEGGVFKFTSTPEEVISKINEFIDKM
jgi:hypothetical protein